MRIISFIALFLFTVEYNSNYSMDFDDYLVKAFVNDILIQEDNRVQVPHFERNFDSEEGDILSFVVRNSCTYLGLRGNVNSNEHTFRFGKELCPLMTEKSGITLSIVTDSKNLGFYDINQYSTVTFLLTIPKVINIEFTEEIITSGIDIDIFRADASKREDVKSMIDFVIDKYGKIDVLVNNAGVDNEKMFIDMELGP